MFVFVLRSVGISALFASIIITLVTLVALVVFAHYDILGCDPLRTGQVRHPNQVLL